MTLPGDQLARASDTWVSATRGTSLTGTTDQRADIIRLVGLNVSLKRMDGGGKRVNAFLRALQAGGLDVEVIGVGPQGIDGADKIVSSPLHRVKRRFLPVPLRGRVESELAGLPNRVPTVSLVPSANRWALDHKPAWLDFPDLWSNIARNHAATVGGVSAVFNVAQARLWARREAAEKNAADVVSTASWSDQLHLGKRAVWLPTPVADSVDLLSRRRAQSSAGSTLVYGLLANFDYPPNRDAYQRLIREWLPILSSSASRVIVAGFGSHGLPRVMDVDVIGAIGEVTKFYDQVDIVLAPIERGGGMKVKVVEAMMYGVPVIATQHARDGLPPAIADECLAWEQMSGGGADHIIGLRGTRDPRESATAAVALESFTFDSFQKKFDSVWRERMQRNS